MNSVMVAILALFVACAPSLADAPDIRHVTAQHLSNGWRFDVTILHPDSGWDHYADGWSVNTPDGKELGHRTLAHPHVNEQPFTRSLSGVQIPNGLTEVVIRAHDSVDGWSDTTYLLKLQ